MQEHLTTTENEPSHFEATSVQFSDGEVAYSSEVLGDTLEWGTFKYADPEHSLEDQIVIRTETGNSYFIREGLLVDMNATRDRGHAAGAIIENLPEGLPPVTIGEKWEVPGFRETTRVTGVLIRTRQWQNTKVENLPQIPTANLFDRLSQEVTDIDSGKIPPRHPQTPGNDISPELQARQEVNATAQVLRERGLGGYALYTALTRQFHPDANLTNNTTEQQKVVTQFYKIDKHS